jgi:hypothetical protein
VIRLKSLHHAASVGLAAIVAVALLTSSASQAQQAYPSPEDAAAALAAAVKVGTRSAILKVLGKDGQDIIESGDDVADAETRQRFLSAYDAKHSIKAEGNKKATLILGADDFPFSIPLANNRTGWEFDAAAGRLEILYRRIGRNELDAIQTCLAFVVPRTNMPKKIARARGRGSTHNASSAAQARRMGCSGATIATRARLANWRRKHRPKGTRSQSRRRPITAIIIEF